jgi:hypothetical protein
MVLFDKDNHLLLLYSIIFIFILTAHDDHGRAPATKQSIARSRKTLSRTFAHSLFALCCHNYDHTSTVLLY